MLTDERYKQLMNECGLLNSRSVLQVLKQCAMEAALIEREACANLCDGKLKYLYLSQGKDPKEQALIITTIDDCVTAIRNR